MGVDPKAGLSIYVLLLLLTVPSMVDASDGRLEVYAGCDKEARVGVALEFNDAWIHGPDPSDPDARYYVSWDFDLREDRDGDGIRDNDGESLDLFTTWTFPGAGQYTVTLTVTDDNQTDKDTLSVTVVENWAPEIDVVPEETATVGRPFELRATARDRDHYHEHLSWDWDLGDGTTSTEPGPINHTYRSLGNFTVRVTVTDPEGAWDEATMCIHVVDRFPPVADAGEYQAVRVGQLVTLDGTASHDNLRVETWRWSIHLNVSVVTLEGPRPSFRFEEAGEYRVRLTVMDSSGNEGYHTVTILVLEGGGPDGDGSVQAHPAVGPGGYRWGTLTALVAALAVSLIANLAMAKE